MRKVDVEKMRHQSFRLRGLSRDGLTEAEERQVAEFGEWVARRADDRGLHKADPYGTALMLGPDASPGARRAWERQGRPMPAP